VTIALWMRPGPAVCLPGRG